MSYICTLAAFPYACVLLVDFDALLAFPLEACRPSLPSWFVPSRSPIH